MPHNTERFGFGFVFCLYLLITAFYCVLSNFPSHWSSGSQASSVTSGSLSLSAIVQFQMSVWQFKSHHLPPLQGTLPLGVWVFSMLPRPMGHALGPENQHESQTQPPCTIACTWPRSTRASLLHHPTHVQAAWPPAPQPPAILLRSSPPLSRPGDKSGRLPLPKQMSNRAPKASLPFLQARPNFSPHLICWKNYPPASSPSFMERGAVMNTVVPKGYSQRDSVLSSFPQNLHERPSRWDRRPESMTGGRRT